MFNWKHFHTGTSPPSGSWKVGCKNECCWIMACLPPACHFPSLAVPAQQQGRGQTGRGSLDGEHQPLHQCCPHLRGRTIPHTHNAPSLSQLFETPPSQQNTSVANIVMQEGIWMVENVADVGEEERVLGKHCSAHWQERRTAVAVEPQHESYSDNKLQHITWVWGVLSRSHRQMWLQSSLYASGTQRKCLLMILQTHPCTL